MSRQNVVTCDECGSRAQQPVPGAVGTPIGWFFVHKTDPQNRYMPNREWDLCSSGCLLAIADKEVSG